ncbi:MAG: HD domain-containing protein [Lachnospiraceae bacterium]|nr:HD domain-containing protein [Lachnospiraceae bacterium]
MTAFRERLQKIGKSEVFSRMDNRTHHMNTTLKDHVFSALSTSKKVAVFLKKRGVRINEEELYIATLCHDLGMVDRDDKTVFKNQADLALHHGDRSLFYAREILKDDLSERETDSIKHHMFPIGRPPVYPEGWILSTVDKYVTIKDFILIIFERLQRNP